MGTDTTLRFWHLLTFPLPCSTMRLLWNLHLRKTSGASPSSCTASPFPFSKHVVIFPSSLILHMFSLILRVLSACLLAYSYFLFKTKLQLSILCDDLPRISESMILYFIIKLISWSIYLCMSSLLDYKLTASRPVSDYHCFLST